MPRFAYALCTASSSRPGTCECRAPPAGGNPPWLNRRLVTSKGVEPDSDLSLIGRRLASDRPAHVARCHEGGDMGCQFLRSSSSGRNPVSAGKTKAPSSYDVLIP